MMTLFKSAVGLVMLTTAESGSGCGTTVPLPHAVGAATLSLNGELAPADDPVGDLLREIGRRKLREEMIKALDTARREGKEPGEVYFNRSKEGSSPNEAPAAATAPPVDAGGSATPDPGRKDRRRGQ